MVLPLIPLILGASALSLALAGLKKGADAYGNFSAASLQKKDALEHWTKVADGLEATRLQVLGDLNLLAHTRLQVQSKSLAKFKSLLDQVIQSDIQEIKIEGYALPIELAEPSEIAAAVHQASTFLHAGMTGVGVGAAVGTGAIQAVGALGTASSGAAISALSGAASTNALMAWFGGGSLASGGLGIAGGTLVLGGVVAGPVVMVLGLLAAGESEKALTASKKYASDLEVAEESLKSFSVMLDMLRQRAKELDHTLKAMDERFDSAASRVSRMLGRIKRDREAVYLDDDKPVPPEVANGKVEYTTLHPKDSDSFNRLVVLGSALFQAAKIELLDSEGKVRAESKSEIEQANQVKEQI